MNTQAQLDLQYAQDILQRKVMRNRGICGKGQVKDFTFINKPIEAYAEDVEYFEYLIFDEEYFHCSGWFKTTKPKHYSMALVNDLFWTYAPNIIIQGKYDYLVV